MNCDLELLEKKFHACSLWTPTYHIKMGSGPGAHSRPRGKDSEQPTGLWSCLRISLPVSDTMYTPWFYLNVCIVWHMASPTTISFPCGEGMGSFCCNVKGMCADPLPCINCWEVPNVQGSRIPYWRLVLLFILYYVGKSLFHPVFGYCCVFLGLRHQYAMDRSAWPLR